MGSGINLGYTCNDGTNFALRIGSSADVTACSTAHYGKPRGTIISNAGTFKTNIGLGVTSDPDNSGLIGVLPNTLVNSVQLGKYYIRFV